MSTDPPPSRGSSPYLRPRLSLSTVNNMFSRRNSKCSEQRPSTGNSSGLLSPLEPTRSRSTSTSRSVRSLTSRSASKWISGLKRSRSASINSAVSEDSQPLTKEDFKEVKGWFDAFEKYNTLITNQVSVDPVFPRNKLSEIQKTITKVEDGGFIHDLPEALFDIALLWAPAGDMTRKSAEGPSWSWTGWTGRINFPFDPSTCPDVRRRGEAAILLKTKVGSFALGSESASEQYTIINRYMALNAGPESTQRCRIEYPTAGLRRPLGSGPRKVESHTLRFTAEKVAASAFKTIQIKHDDDQPLLCTGLLDSQDRKCGVLMDYEKNISAHQGKGKLHYVLLSINRRVPSTSVRSRSNVSHPSGIPIWREGAFLKDEEIEDPEEYDNNGEWKMYNVMLIQEFEEGYAERVAIGRIHEDAWNEAKKLEGNGDAKIVLQ